MGIFLASHPRRYNRHKCKGAKMSENMFCFQCEQTAGGQACTVRGVCGKQPSTAHLQDHITEALVRLACRVKDRMPTEAEIDMLLDGLFTTITNVDFNDNDLEEYLERINADVTAEGPLDPECKAAQFSCEKDIWSAQEDVRSLKSLILFGIRGVAAYEYHARVLGSTNMDIISFLFDALRALARTTDADELTNMVFETGMINLQAMEDLNVAHIEHYGKPEPTAVSLEVQPGPFIVISGHDLHDLELLLEQTRDKGVDVYTHGEMLPAHGYPLFKRYENFKGHFGTAWQNQQKEFVDVPGAFLFTTNCIMPVKESYADHVFTTGVVSYPGLIHIGEDKDFTPVINRALELGGYSEPKQFTGINGGMSVMTGFGHDAVLSHAETIVEAVKSGAIKNFLLVGGCDGAKPGRNYYTEIVKEAPEGTVVLTLACGKFRFNDLDIGEIGGLPRLMDVGQCNDAYSAIKIALALAEAFDCSVNELPLSIVLSWYEQKAVSVLLTLLALGITDIRLGPTLPAFVSPTVLNLLVEKFNIAPITTPAEDLQTLLN